MIQVKANLLKTNGVLIIEPVNIRSNPNIGEGVLISQTEDEIANGDLPRIELKVQPMSRLLSVWDAQGINGVLIPIEGFKNTISTSMPAIDMINGNATIEYFNQVLIDLIVEALGLDRADVISI